jgi:hypothetical protein
LSGVQSLLKAYGFSTTTIIDINIANRGARTDDIAKLKINVENLFQFDYDPCQGCLRSFADGIYTINFKSVVEGASEFLISHTIEPNKIEKIHLVLGGDFKDRASYLARITLSIYTGSGNVLKTPPLDVLVKN